MLKKIICIIIVFLLLATGMSAVAQTVYGNPGISGATSRIVSGDFDGDGLDEIAQFAYLGSGRTILNMWQSNNYNFTYNHMVWDSVDGFYASNITGRVVSGDFNGDGLDDICAFYDYGSGYTRAFVWRSTGTGFIRDWNWYYTLSGFDSTRITDKVTAGDFNNDGKDDICTFYDYGNGETRAFVFQSTGSSFSVQWNWFYSPSGYDANLITGRVTSGDYTGDGKDDVCAFFDYGNGETRAFVYRSTGTAFVQEWNWFYSASGFDANLITGRVVSGDFNGDYRYDDVCAFFDYGNGATTAFVFRSTGTAFVQDWNWYSTTSGFDSTKITGRVLSGRFDIDLKDDICTFYDYANTNKDTHAFVFTSTGTSFTCNWNWFSNSLKYNTVYGMFDDKGTQVIGGYDSADNNMSVWINSSVGTACNNMGCSQYLSYMGGSNQDVINSIKSSSYFAIATHGLPTNIMCNSLTGSAPNYIYNFSYVNSSDISVLPDNYFNTTQCVLLSACQTGSGGANDSNNLVNRLHSKGVWTVIGFQDNLSFTHDVGNKGSMQWSRIFTTSLGNGNTVNAAKILSDQAVMSSDGWMCGLDSIYIAGDENLIVKN